jgi:hypothetical protein
LTTVAACDRIAPSSVGAKSRFAGPWHGHGCAVTLKSYILRTVPPQKQQSSWVQVRNRRSTAVIARERAADDGRDRRDRPT